MIEDFKADVDQGLSSNPKTLPSKYFYDKKGDALFIEIMNLPEYYLYRSELDIFKNKTQVLIDSLNLNSHNYFEIIELGAGNGAKTKELLSLLTDQNHSFKYYPIDISTNALDLIEYKLNKSLPGVSVEPEQGDYFKILSSLKENKSPKVILFLGSNIGNMDDETATQFIDKLGANLYQGDKLLLGVDLIKSLDIVLPAYNDSQGITAQFNLNLLRRINNQLGGDFNLDQFRHQPEYNEKTGVAISYIVSTVNQSVHIHSTGKTFHFLEGEKIKTEISRKYNDTIIQKIISKTNFTVLNKVLDSNGYFADYILEKR